MNELFQRFSKDPRITFQLVVATFFINLLALATSLFVIQVLNRYISHGVNATLTTLATGTLIAIGFEMAFRSIRRQLIEIQNAEQNTLLSERAFDVLLQTRMPVLDRVSVGKRTEILRGLDSLRAITMPQTVAAVLDLPFAFLFVLVLWWLSPYLALVSVIVIALSVVLAWQVQLGARKDVSQLQEAASARAGLLNSAATAGETIREFNGSGFLSTGWRKTDTAVSLLGVRMANARDFLQAKIGFVTSLQTIGIISVGALQVVNGDLSVGAMIGANILAGRALMPVSRLVQMGGAFTSGQQSGDRLREFLTLPLERSEGTALREYDGAAQFKDLAFMYPGASVLLFESLELRLKPGQTALIVGPNGSGKTTLTRLLTGILEPSRGQIMVGGLDLQQIALPWWRQQVSYLPQEPLLVTGTLKDNISLANPNIDNAWLNEIIRMAGLRPFLENSKEGLEMVIHEGGRHLALGIRRRISLARALATNGKLFIADEPTEGLDLEGRQAVYQVFQNLKAQKKTIFVISHDESFRSIADYRIDLSVKPVPNVQARRPAESAVTHSVSVGNKG